MVTRFSLTQLLETVCNESQRSMDGGRGRSIESALSDEIRNLIPLSEARLIQVEHMNIDDKIPTHEDGEVSVMFDEDTTKDDIS